MAEKKSKHDETDGDGDQKKPPGRPKVLPPDLDKRHQLRCSTADFGKWVAYATKLGFPNVSAWLRKVANDAVASAKRAAR